MRGGVRGGAIAAALAFAAACGSSSPTSPGTGPTGTQPGVTPGNHISTGTAVNAVTSAGAGVVSFTVNGTLVGVSESTGAFSVGFHNAGVNRTVLTAGGFVERQTGIQAPAANLQLSLIPSTFDLNSFNQMFRHAPVGGQPGLTRWTTPPALIIERRVLQFTNVNAASYTALDETLTDAEVASIIADMTEGYANLTGGLLGTFSSVSSRTTAPGAAVPLGEAGAIVVTRQADLSSLALQQHGIGYWGYARWSTTPNGAVTSGFIILDRNFERGATFAQVRPSLRMHELGHTLGCQHVSPAFKSVMNPDAQTLPNDFDRSAARIAHLRPVGNRAPDIDPIGHSATTLSGVTAAPTWHGAR